MPEKLLSTLASAHISTRNLMSSPRVESLRRPVDVGGREVSRSRSGLSLKAGVTDPWLHECTGDVKKNEGCLALERLTGLVSACLLCSEPYPTQQLNPIN